MKRKKVIIALTVILLLLGVVVGCLFLERPAIIDRQRQAAEKQLMALIESGETRIGSVSAPAVEGEEDEFSELPAEEPVEVTGYGIIVIDAIELKMPLVQGADNYSLRAAAGWLPESAQMGAAGNCVVFGHRMYEYGRHFNRLDELEEGDEVKLYNALGDSFTYVVTGKEVIAPDELMDKLEENNEGYRLTLVTCTPTGIGDHRLLVYASLDNDGEVKTDK